MSVFFILFLASAQSQTVTATENPIQVGKNVTLNSSENVIFGTWTFEGDLVVFIAGGNYIKSDDWTDRVAYNLSTSSLTITSLKVEDSGDWKLQSADGGFRASLDLSVQGKGHFFHLFLSTVVACLRLLFCSRSEAQLGMSIMT